MVDFMFAFYHNFESIKKKKKPGKGETTTDRFQGQSTFWKLLFKKEYGFLKN